LSRKKNNSPFVILYISFSTSSQHICTKQNKQVQNENHVLRCWFGPDHVRLEFSIAMNRGLLFAETTKLDGDLLLRVNAIDEDVVQLPPSGTCTGCQLIALPVGPLVATGSHIRGLG
jgi:hypothetical protein